jgi:DnaJ-class molecular chaperone
MNKRKLFLVLVVLLVASVSVFAGYKYVTCPTCNGRTTVTCFACGGSGKAQLPNGFWANCKVCVGQGYNACTACDGFGRISIWVDEDE